MFRSFSTTLLTVLACIVLALLIHPMVAQAQEAQWEVIVETKTKVFEANLTTLGYTKAKDKTYVTVVGRTSIKGDTKVSFFTWLVTPEQCTDGQGMLAILPVNETVKPYLAPFVSGGGNVASDIADSLCLFHTFYQKMLNERAAKPSSSALRSGI